MPSPAAEEDGEEGSDVPPKDDIQVEEDEEAEESSALAGARVSAAAVRPTCCVCMESWTCNGAHRICCIPCGHVYGRLCLEKWLNACGTSAKCPQCSEVFEHKHITNLYVPGNLWDGCCHIQETEAHKIAKFAAGFMPLVTRHMSEAKLALHVSGVAETAAKMKVLAQSIHAENQPADRKVVLDVLKMVNTSYALAIEQMEMMQGQYQDLVAFMVQNFKGLVEVDSK